MLVLLALASILTASTSVSARLPEASAFLGPANLVWMLACLAGVKVLHELGHALTCHHFGCRCHEIGVLFLVFAPCLYCDITDSWTLPDKRQRMAISAAGIFVELVLASIATLLWWATADGLFHALCLNVMFLCSINTVLLNGNPLLRYDGYYVLSDWLEIPNLWQRSRSVLTERLARLFLGESRAQTIPEDRPFLLASYGVASIVYRWIVVLAILRLLYHLLRPLELDLLAHTVTAVTIIGLLAGPITGLGRALSAPGHQKPPAAPNASRWRQWPCSS